MVLVVLQFEMRVLWFCVLCLSDQSECLALFCLFVCLFVFILISGVLLVLPFESCGCCFPVTTPGCVLFSVAYLN